MLTTDIREAVERHGPRPVAEKIVKGLRSNKLTSDGFSLRQCWECFVGDVDRTMPLAMRGPGGLIANPLIEDVKAWAFTAVTQAVLIQQVMAGYDETPGVLDKLVTPFNSTSRTEKVVGFTATGGIRTTPEGQEYAKTGFVDRVTEAPEPDKRGFQIDVTDEAVRFDRTGQILLRARNAGLELRQDREYYGFLAIQDQSTCYAFYPHVSGTPTRTAIYRSSAAGTAWYNKTVNLKTSNGLVNWTQVQVAWALWAAVKDEAGNPILVVPKVLLVPMALAGAGNYAVNSMQSYKSGNAATNEITTYIMGNVAEKVIGGVIDVVTSPYVDAVSATTWYLGDFKRQFVEQVIIPTETREVPGDPSRDIVAAFIARRKSRVSACDDKFVIQNTA